MSVGGAGCGVSVGAAVGAGCGVSDGAAVGGGSGVSVEAGIGTAAWAWPRLSGGAGRGAIGGAKNVPQATATLATRATPRATIRTNLDDEFSSFIR